MTSPQREVAQSPWRATALFAFVCLIWGATWIALKAGLHMVPPVFFAATRFCVAGLALLVWRLARREAIAIARPDLIRFATITALMIVVPYPLLYWGAEWVSSGLAAVIDLALMPAALFVLGSLLGAERFTPVRATGVVIGICGLVVLFAPKIAAAHVAPVAGLHMQIIGGAAIVCSAFVYALGSVLARPLLTRYAPSHVSAITLVGGSIVLLVLSLSVEPGARHAARGAWGEAAWISWLFLVLCGSLIAYTAYLELVRVWGASRAGAYAFVSPIVAVLLGVGVYGETIAATDGAGMVIMLAGAFLTLRSTQLRSSPVSTAKSRNADAPIA